MNMKQNYFKSLLVTMLALFLGTGAYADTTSTLTFTKACGGSGLSRHPQDQELSPVRVLFLQ